MNEAEAAATILEDVANSQVIMMEVLIYGVASIVLILLMDLFAAKAIGDRQSMEYKILKIPRFVSIFIVCMFTVIIGVICLYNDQFSVTRSTLTYFGLPYFIAVFYYLIKMLRRVRSVQKRRKMMRYGNRKQNQKRRRNRSGAFCLGSRGSPI